MFKKISKKRRQQLAVTILVLAAISGALLIMYFYRNNLASTATHEKTSNSAPKEADKSSTKPIEPYQGVSTVVADAFSIKVPNGWHASISNNPNFLAIMFTRPNQLDSLVYNAYKTPIIDYDGIPSWSGLTEHFFVILPTSAQAFDPNDHLEVSSQPFTFDDGTIGQKYYVIKHTDEAQKWGGLQKDTEWQGRTYIYEKDGKKIEAHLALYPSTSVSLSFYENVVRSLKF